MARDGKRSGKVVMSFYYFEGKPTRVQVEPIAFVMDLEKESA